jgi:hypothetical protein
MSQYKRKFNPIPNTSLVPINAAIRMRDTVANQAVLPLSGNAIGDGRVTTNDGHLYVWAIDSSTGLLTDWIDQGNFIDVSWDSISGKPTSSVVDIDAAVTNKHTHANKTILDNIQEALTTLLKNAYDSCVSFVNAFALTGQSLGDVVKWNGSNWVPGSPLNNAGVGVTFYFDDAASGIEDYKTLLSAPLSFSQVNSSILLQNNSVYFPYFFASGALGGTKIDAGVWEFDIWRYVSVISGTTYISFEVYKRTIGGSETLLFSTVTPDINDTANIMTVVTTVQPEFVINSTDILVIKPKGYTNFVNPVTVTFSYGGVNNYSYIRTPVVYRHNDLAGLQGGQTNEYNHLTNTELANIHAANIQFNQSGLSEITGLTDKSTPVDADVTLIESSAHSNAKRKLSWANIKVTLKTYFDTLYNYLIKLQDVGEEILLLHCNGTNGSTNFIDEAGKSITVHRTAQLDTSDKKFGSASCNVAGYSWLTAPDSADFDFGLDDFTIDCWVKGDGTSSLYTGFVCSAHNTEAPFGWKFATWNNKVIFGTYGDYILISDSSLPINTWTHIAVTRKDGIFYLFQNGVLVDSDNTHLIEVIDSAGVGLYIGRWYDDIDDFYWQGHMDEISILKGAAKWTSNFTPPSVEHIFGEFYINPGLIDQSLSVTDGITIDGRDLSVDGTKLDTIEEDAVSLLTVKADPDIQSIKDIALNTMLNAFRIAQVGALTILGMVKGFVDEYESEVGIDLINSEYQLYNSVYDFYSPLLSGADAYNVLLLHCNGIDGSPIFLDSSDSGHTIVTHGDAQVDTTEKKFGTGSLQLDGTGDYLSIADSTDFYFDGDFTIDFWIKLNSTATEYGICGQGTYPADRMYIRANSSGNGLIEFYEQTSAVALISTTNLGTTNWHHIAVVRYGNSWKLYIDGVSEASTTDSDTYGNKSGDFWIGYDPNAASKLNGYIDEFRVSKGVARWMGDFTPSPIEYSSESHNMILISNSQISSVIPDEIRIILFEEDVDSVTINTDLKTYVSRDGGTTFTQVTLEDEGNYITAARILSGVVDVSGQPSGDDIVYKIETLNVKNLIIHGTAVSYR